MITTPRLILRPVVPKDYPRLYQVESDPTTALTWRYRGQLPGPDEYEQALWKQTQQVMVVESRTSGVVIGYLQLHDLDLRAGHGWFSLYSGPDHRGSGLMMEGCMAFCEWAFSNWPIRWLYAHSLEQNLPAFGSSLRRGSTVSLGVLRQRLLIDGELVDVHVLGMERETWLASTVRLRLTNWRARQG